MVHVKMLVHAAGVEEELVGGDGEQGPGQVRTPSMLKSSRFWEPMITMDPRLSRPFDHVPDIGDGREVAQKDVSSSKTAAAFPWCRSWWDM